MSDTAPPDDGAYLESMLRVLWPAPAQVALTGRRPDRRGASGYVVVPSRRRPRLVLPSRPRRATAAAMRNFKTAASAKERVRSSVLALGLRAGLHDWLPDQVVVRPGPSGSPGGIDAHLEDVLGRQVYVCLYVGPARAVRKPVLQLLDDRGATVAFAKLGVDGFTSDLVRAEAAAVAEVSAAGLPGVAVPDVLHAGDWNGQALLVQSALASGRPPTATTPQVARAARGIAGVGGTVSAELAASSYWARLRERIAGLAASEVVARLRRAVEEIETDHGATLLEFGCSHGDFAPWNMTVVDDRLLVWDWEKFERDVPVGADVVHCAVQGAVVLDGVSPATAFTAAREQADALLAPVGNAAAARLVVRLYAVDIAVRYLLDRELDAGLTRMTDLAAWLPRVLEDSDPTDAGRTR